MMGQPVGKAQVHEEFKSSIVQYDIDPGMTEELDVLGPHSVGVVNERVGDGGGGGGDGWRALCGEGGVREETCSGVHGGGVYKKHTQLVKHN